MLCITYNSVHTPGTVEFAAGEEIFDVYVCHVNSPVSFYVQVLGSDDSVSHPFSLSLTCVWLGVKCALQFASVRRRDFWQWRRG